MWAHFRFVTLGLALGLGFVRTGHAQLTLPGFGPASSANSDDKAHARSGGAKAAASATIAPAAIPGRARQDETELDAARRALEAADLNRVTRGLPRFLDAVGQLSIESRSATSQTRRRDLTDLDLRWQVLKDQVLVWQKLLVRRSEVVSRQQQKLDALKHTWSGTSEALKQQPNAPRAALARTEQVLSSIEETEGAVSLYANSLFELQDRLNAEQDTLRDHYERVEWAQNEQRSRVFRADGPTLWQLFTPAHYAAGKLPWPRLEPGYLESCLRAFWSVYHNRLFIDLLLAFALLGSAFYVARQARGRAEHEARQLPKVLANPLDSGLLVVFVCARLVYGRAMFGIIDLLGLMSLVPLYRAMPMLVPEEGLHAALSLMIGTLGLYRVLMLLHLNTPWQEASSLAVAALLVYAAYRMLRSRSHGDRRELDDGLFAKATRLYLRSCVLGLGLALLLAVVGYANLLPFLLDAYMTTTFALLFATALTRVLSAFLAVGLASRRVLALRSVQAHGQLLHAQALGLVRALCVVLWLVAALKAFGVMEVMVDYARAVFGATAHVGSWSLSLGDVTSFALTMYLATKLAGLISLTLEDDVLPRMSLGRGVPAAISRMTRYAILGLGFIFAVGAAGVDMSRVAMLASALSIGIGFGLQNVVSNFVSGLMLIFERPVRVGDTVQVGELMGEVRNIGIRASTLRTFQGAEVILPNADLISEQVINWTLSDVSRRVEIPVGVAYGSDPKQVLALLVSAVADLDGINKQPAPLALFTAFGESSLDFELRIWVRLLDNWPFVRSAALISIYERLTENGIEIPFPQRDLHVRSIDEPAAQELAKQRAPAPSVERP
jgi:small-conductance mechanosensitive channel